MVRFGRLFDKMGMTRRAVVAWLAVFALFAQALMPLSSALAFDAGTDGEFRVICTASGVKTLAIGENGQPVNAVQEASCPFCLVHAATALLPAQAPSVITFARQAKPIFVLPRVQRHASLWRAQPRLPRGPPPTA